MIQISLCMIVKDEQNVLARCLDHVKDVVDEIVIVDTGSTDRTKQIAKGYTDRVYDLKWEDDFAAARNFAFSKGTKDYLLWLDADDVLLEQDAEKLLRLKQTLSQDVDMVMMQYHVAFDEEGNPSFSYERERLVKREKAYQWQGAVHEAIVPSGNILHTDIAITHQKVHPSDPDRNLRILEKIKQSTGLDPRQEFYYARELVNHHRDEDAVKVFCEFLDTGKGWVENNINACLDLSQCYQRLGQKKKVLESLFHSFVFDQPRAEICCEIGSYFLQEQQYQQAIYWYQAALRCNRKESSGGFILPDCYDFIPNIQLCVCYDRLGDHCTAYRYHQVTERLKPHHPMVVHNRGYFRSILHNQLN